MKKPQIVVPEPALQIAFSEELRRLRKLYLQEALFAAIEEVDLRTIDLELAQVATATDLKALARHGLRGELLFPTPSLLRCRPRLLGYYRLLLGFSQKEFYTAASGLSVFKTMESSGSISPNADAILDIFCAALSPACSTLAQGLRASAISRELLHDLTLLTLGAQLRGGANVKKGSEGIKTVFNAIHKIVAPHVISSTPQDIALTNAAGREVHIAFAQDPDIVIRETMGKGSHRSIIAIEVKGGTDYSNIHNRLGEAEKSHQKARQSGYVECWTVVNVSKLDLKKAHAESPSTNRFYSLSNIIAGKGDEFEDFRNRIVSLAGIPSDPLAAKRTRPTRKK